MPPPDANVTFQYAEKGSYRQEHILRYLRRTLSPWSALRAEAKDWRLLYMDLAQSHVGPAVIQQGVDNGYVTLYHYGCTTGVGQVNDTDIHQDLEAKYIELEQACFHEQQLWDPGNINRTVQQVTDDLCSAWRATDHLRGLRGHKTVGISVALDGSEDWMISREALDFWQAARIGGLTGLRAEAVAKVDAMVDSGQLTGFHDWQKLVEHPEDPGVMEDEGDELQDPLSEGEAVCDEDGREQAADDFDVECLDHPVAVAALPVDDPAAVAEAVVLAQRYEALKIIKAVVDRHNVPAASNIVEREIVQISRGLRAGNRKEEKQANNVLRRHMDERFKKEMAAIQARRKQAFDRRRNLAVAKAALAKARLAKEARQQEGKAAKEKAVKELAEKAAKLASLPKKISSADVGTFSAKGDTARMEALERVKLNSPKLTEDRELRWEYVRDRFAKEPPLHLSHNAYGWGVAFVGEIDTLLKSLGRHYLGHSLYNGKDSKVKGDPDAFQKFFDRMDKSLKAIGVEVVC